MTQSSCSDTRAVFNIILSAIGVGVVALPKVLASTGWLGGFGLMLFGAFVANSAVLKLALAFKSTGSLPGSAPKTYEELGGKLLGQVGFLITATTVHVTMSGCCIVLLIMIAKAAEELHRLGRLYWLSIFGIAMLPLCLLNGMGKVGYVSAVGTAAVFCLAVVLVVASASSRTGSLSRSLFIPAPFTTFVSSLSVTVFSFNIANTAPSLLNSMEKPGNFKKVVLFGAIGIFLIYSVIACSGYAGWGGNIVNYDTVIDLVVESSGRLKYFCVISVLLMAVPHFVVLFHPILEGIERVTNQSGIEKTSHLMLLRTLTRIGILLSFMAVAYLVESVDTAIQLLAAFTMSFICLLLPVGFYWRAKRMTKGSTGLGEKLLCFIIAATGIVLLTVGGAEALQKTI